MMGLKRNRRIACFTAILLIVCIMMVGCTGGQKAGMNYGMDEKLAGDDFEYPMEGNVKLTYFTRVKPADFQNYSYMPWYDVEKEKTGVTIEYIHPAAGQGIERFNLLMASGEFPDIVRFDWLRFPGGPQKAIDDEHIIALNEAIEKYAPNFKKELESDPELARHLKTDTGEYYSFPMIRMDDSLVVFKGLFLREDWLRDVSLPVPETIDEWYITLKAFKEKKGAKAPLTDSNRGIIPDGTFSGAFGVINDFYVDNGVVKYGPMEDNFKDYIATMAKWYKEGLIDPDVATVDRRLSRTKILNGESGAMQGLLGGDMGAILTSTQERKDGFSLTGAPYPVLKKGDKPMFGQREHKVSDGEGVAISTNCNNIGAAVRFLDWGYSEEGKLLYNFGIEGESYNMVDGYPKYVKTDDGSLPSEYLRINGPGLNDPRYFEQNIDTPAQQKALEMWVNTDAAKYKLPAVTPLTTEASDFANIMSEVKTYSEEMFLRFLFGNEPIEKFDDYTRQIKALGIEKALNILQSALERYELR